MHKYEPLFKKLQSSVDSSVTMTFDEISSLVGELPASAYNHRAWWSNEENGQHVQAHSWMKAGFRVIQVEMSRTVTFEKA